MEGLKAYLITISSVFLIIVLLFYFRVLPSLMKILNEISHPEARVIKNRLFYVTIGSLIITPLIALYSFKKVDSLEKAKKEIETILKINPQDASAKNKLGEIERERKNLYLVLPKILGIFISLVVGLIIVSIISPLYRLMIKTF